MNYYQGLSFMELKEKSKANAVFNALVESGDKMINNTESEGGEFFAIFGEREDENTRNSRAYALRGLGYKGLGKIELAAADLKKAIEWSESNLWARTELNL